MAREGILTRTSGGQHYTVQRTVRSGALLLHLRNSDSKELFLIRDWGKTAHSACDQIVNVGSRHYSPDGVVRLPQNH